MHAAVLLLFSSFLTVSSTRASNYAEVLLRVTVWPTDKLQSVAIRFDRDLLPAAVAASFCATLVFEAGCESMVEAAVAGVRNTAEARDYAIGIDSFAQIYPLVLQMDDTKQGIHVSKEICRKIPRDTAIRFIDLKFRRAVGTKSDISEHVEVLQQYASQSFSIVDVGVRSAVATSAYLHGLVHSIYGDHSEPTSLSMYDLHRALAPMDIECLAYAMGIEVKFVAGDILQETILPTDLLFIGELCGVIPPLAPPSEHCLAAKHRHIPLLRTAQARARADGKACTKIHSSSRYHG
jgi:hypothetical protein